ncbi:Glycosyltransferase involved in cell wall bisynthesis [Flavobacterium swingsii]|uniref:Glycosyltransferase involved in cell wall bisynthesis n=1 Tax=Flavobacterium swingsii TaxID=498292 RepID=A0A1I0Z865_9FLAO|nr:glycosyltransferase [Flavobacterium swingsii]SFB21296.1 Glycosyltransferase involved in cell wall bisynthesis [Flavobacterium swingsii]
MTFVIVTHVPHIIENNQYFAYSPYVREMNVWLKYVDKVIIVAPIENAKTTPIHIHYEHTNITFVAIGNFDILSAKSIFQTLFKIPSILFKIFSSFKKADHIHLRCPGNVGLLGSLVQILFLSKTKTAKYAGNWDSKAKSPISYRLQKYILSHTFLTRNMQVLVYGEWENSTKNIKPFFTATYKESDKEEVVSRNLQGIIKILFVGTLSIGKRPLYAIQLVEKLIQNGFQIEFSIFGEGKERKNIEEYISENKLQDSLTLHGNKTTSIIQKAYQESHFVLLPSQSEGWPKVIAEGMFWGCVPIATSISCVPNMLDYGNRGLLLQVDLEKDVKTIQELINNSALYQEMASNGIKWSRKYTLDYFEQEIKLLLQS